VAQVFSRVRPNRGLDAIRGDAGVAKAGGRAAKRGPASCPSMATGGVSPVKLACGSVAGSVKVATSVGVPRQVGFGRKIRRCIPESRRDSTAASEKYFGRDSCGRAVGVGVPSVLASSTITTSQRTGGAPAPRSAAACVPPRYAWGPPLLSPFTACAQCQPGHRCPQILADSVPAVWAVHGSDSRSRIAPLQCGEWEPSCLPRTRRRLLPPTPAP
jgi:hypothetical protein